MPGGGPDQSTHVAANQRNPIQIQRNYHHGLGLSRVFVLTALVPSFKTREPCTQQRRCRKLFLPNNKINPLFCGGCSQNAPDGSLLEFGMLPNVYAQPPSERGGILFVVYVKCLRLSRVFVLTALVPSFKTREPCPPKRRCRKMFYAQTP